MSSEKLEDQNQLKLTETNAKRRQLFGGAVASAVVASALPSAWTKPVVDAVILPAHAQTTTTTVMLSATINAAQEVPTPVGATATGSATVTLDTQANTIVLTGSVSGLTGNAVAAHIHGPAAAGATAGVLVPLVLGGADLSNPTLSFSGAFPAANISDLMNGMTYINVHTAANAPGEVRGQIVP